MGCACACPDTQLSVSQVGRGPCAFPKPCSPSQAQRGPEQLGWALRVLLPPAKPHWCRCRWAEGCPCSLHLSRVDGGQPCRAEASGCVHPGLHLFTQHRQGREGPRSPGKGRDEGQH